MLIKCLLTFHRELPRRGSLLVFREHLRDVELLDLDVASHVVRLFSPEARSRELIDGLLLVVLHFYFF